MAALPFIAAAASATATLAETAQARAVGAAQARGIEEQARAVGLETGLIEENQRKAARRQFGETRAAGAQFGLLESPSFVDAANQAAVMAELDALNIRYEGETKRKGLLYESAVTRAARPKWGPAILSAGTNALMAFAGAGGDVSSLKLPKIGGRAPAPTTSGSRALTMNFRAPSPSGVRMG